MITSNYQNPLNQIYNMENLVQKFTSDGKFITNGDHTTKGILEYL
jgi:hypothetical protein